MSPLRRIRELFTELMGWTNEELEAVDFIMASYISPFIPGAGERAVPGSAGAWPRGGRV